MSVFGFEPRDMVIAQDMAEKILSSRPYFRAYNFVSGVAKDWGWGDLVAIKNDKFTIEFEPETTRYGNTGRIIVTLYFVLNGRVIVGAFDPSDFAGVMMAVNDEYELVTA